MTAEPPPAGARDRDRLPRMAQEPFRRLARFRVEGALKVLET